MGRKPQKTCRESLGKNVMYEVCRKVPAISEPHLDFCEKEENTCHRHFLTGNSFLDR